MKKCYHRLAGVALLTLFLPVGAWAQDIRGMVVDSKTQEPLVGATVQVKGTSLGVATDIDGKFHFEGLDKSKSYTLVIQYVSYKTKILTEFGLRPTAQKMTCASRWRLTNSSWAT